MDVPRPGVESELQLPAYTTAKATSDPTAFVTYMAAWGNTWSLTHWARPGIEPESSQRQCHVLNPLSHNGNSREYLENIFLPYSFSPAWWIFGPPLPAGKGREPLPFYTVVWTWILARSLDAPWAWSLQNSPNSPSLNWLFQAGCTEDLNGLRQNKTIPTFPCH